MHIAGKCTKFTCLPLPKIGVQTLQAAQLNKANMQAAELRGCRHPEWTVLCCANIWVLDAKGKQRLPPSTPLKRVSTAFLTWGMYRASLGNEEFTSFFKGTDTKDQKKTEIPWELAINIPSNVCQARKRIGFYTRKKNMTMILIMEEPLSSLTVNWEDGYTAQFSRKAFWCPLHHPLGTSKCTVYGIKCNQRAVKMKSHNVAWPQSPYPPVTNGDSFIF